MYPCIALYNHALTWQRLTTLQRAFRLHLTGSPPAGLSQYEIWPQSLLVRDQTAKPTYR